MGAFRHVREEHRLHAFLASEMHQIHRPPPEKKKGPGHYEGGAGDA